MSYAWSMMHGAGNRSPYYGTAPQMQPGCSNVHQTHWVMNGVDIAAFEMLKQGGWTADERATLQQIKHSNDRRLNSSWGPNPFHGPQDSTVDALDAMSEMAQNRQDRHK